VANRLGLAGALECAAGDAFGRRSGRAGLAVALAAAPPILLCDEPTAEVDAETERQIIADLAPTERCRGYNSGCDPQSGDGRGGGPHPRLSDGRLVDD